jgi:streptogrisin C
MDTDDERVCSLGFHAADAAGRPVLLTAGHCGRRTSAFTRDGRVVGQVADARFPVDDFAVVWLDGDGGWAPQPWVDRYDTSPAAIRDHSTAPVGSTVCKSGATTRWTCGRIVAHDVTVSYDGGDVVYGLTQASTCSEGGDSGGPLLAGPSAQGMLSGGRSVEGRCLEQYGMENVSYFQPVAEPLSRYGLRLLTAS